PRAVGRQEPEQGPGGLRWRALTLPGKRLVVVGGDRLAPAAVRVLPRPEPLDGAPDVRRSQVLADGLQPFQRAPRAVEEVDAPAAPPRAVRTLRPAQELDRPTGAAEPR